MNSRLSQETTATALNDTFINFQTEKMVRHSTDEQRSRRSSNTPNGLLLSVEPADDPTPSPQQPSMRPPRSRRPDHHKMPSTIPPEHKHRTLVLCFDGTGDQFDADNSNVVQLCSLLKKEDRSKQMVYYQAGIGTYTKVATPVMSKISKAVNMMIAADLDSHVMEGYEFLMQNYTAGDRICLFGFSRGAYTARSLAGMLYKVGLLPADNFQQVPFAYKMYTRVDELGWEQSTAFKEAFSREVTIDFLGVWDSVESVGLISKRLPFTTTNNIVRTFRHALSLDERRAKFKPYLWSPKDHSREPRNLSRPVRSTSYRNSTQSSALLRHSSKSPSQRASPLPSFEWESTEDKQLSEHEETFSLHSHDFRETDVQEVWFAGCHCDVGGGSVKNGTHHSLARVSLRWMIRECFKAETGIMFDTERLKFIGLDPSTLYPFVIPRAARLSASGDAHTIQQLPQKPTLWHRIRQMASKRSASTHSSVDVKHVQKENGTAHLSEEEEELHDALAAKYDQLKIRPPWWILEIIPMQFRYQRKRDEWVTCFGSNWANPRIIPEEGKLLVHRSVKTRMEAKKIRSNGKPGKYMPKAQFEAIPHSWVD
ncbi:hypothetical protein GYMLUDRAFT_36672 [Collybiopsis luxurians FD-317 M1]|nr:hypothetical protein GYMLUDRAFT_36672 [Collybiopsis luxurians FD-317 M1]